MSVRDFESSRGPSCHREVCVWGGDFESSRGPSCHHGVCVSVRAHDSVCSGGPSRRCGIYVIVPDFACKLGPSRHCGIYVGLTLHERDCYIVEFNFIYKFYTCFVNLLMRCINGASSKINLLYI